MKATKYIPAIFAVALFLLIVKSFFDQYVPNYDFPDWQHGASGYELALKEAEATGEPLILYFHTSWCGWCEKLDKNYLATNEIESFLRNIPKVEINPDKGRPEKGIFKKFGLTGYPSFLVLIPKLSGDPMMLSPFSKGRELSIEEFLHEIRKRIASEYNNGGYSFSKNNKYEDALRYYRKALKYDPKSAHTYYRIGVLHYTVAKKNRDKGLLKEAETNYLKALEIDPDHQESKKGLASLQ